MDTKRQCSATSKQSGNRCKRAPIHGGFVCKMHGGGTPQAKRKAAERLRDMLAEAVDPDHSLRESARIAYSDLRELYDADGNLLPVKDWPDDIARAVAQVEMVRRNVDATDGKTDQVIKVRLWDKNQAQERLFKHLGLLKESMEHKGSIEIRWKDGE